MTIRETIINDLKTSMKLKASKNSNVDNEITISTLRLAKSAITVAETDKTRIEKNNNVRENLNDNEVETVLRKMVKERLSTAVEFREYGEEERAVKEENEAKILEKYLPSLLTEEETRALIVEIVEKLPEKSPKMIGKVMGQLKNRNDVDKGLASKIVKEELAK